MPIDYKGYTVPELDDGANANVAFKQFADSVVAAGGGGVPVGCVMPYVGDTAPDATWRICDGQELDVTVYHELFAVIGAKFGTASAGYFKLPDMRGAVPRGAGNSGLGGGWAGGTIGSAPTAPESLALTTSHMPSHAHAQTNHSHSALWTGSISSNGTHSHSFGLTAGSDGTHDHDVRITSASNYTRSGTGSGANVASSNSGNRTASSGAHTHPVTGTITNDGYHSHTVSGGVSIDNGGGGNLTAAAGSASPTAINLVGPAVSLNYIIKVKP